MYQAASAGDPLPQDSYCGLCGAQKNLMKTKCCDQTICDDHHKYVSFTHARGRDSLKLHMKISYYVCRRCSRSPETLVLAITSVILNVQTISMSDTPVRTGRHATSASLKMHTTRKWEHGIAPIIITSYEEKMIASIAHSCQLSTQLSALNVAKLSRNSSLGILPCPETAGSFVISVSHDQPSSLSSHVSSATKFDSTIA